MTKYSLEDYKPYAEALAKKVEGDKRLRDSEDLLVAAKRQREEAEATGREVMELEAEALLGGKNTGNLKDKLKEARRKAEEADKAAGDAEHTVKVLKIGLEKLNREVEEQKKLATEQLIKTIRKDHGAAMVPLIEAARQLSAACVKELEIREAASDALVDSWSVSTYICPVPSLIHPGLYDDRDSKLGRLVVELREYGYAGI
ncbi:MAG: hypothetical protein M1489_06005 [Firmicutes bacterium]|nr:hypothetical protein [Bacillota bacterium]